MADVRKQNINVKTERRAFPRLEFHCTAKIATASPSIFMESDFFIRKT
jgi:hypothetical protein